MEKEQQSKNWGVFYERKGKNKSGIGGSRRILSATLEALSGKKGGYDSGSALILAKDTTLSEVRELAC